MNISISLYMYIYHKIYKIIFKLYYNKNVHVLRSTGHSKTSFTLHNSI